MDKGLNFDGDSGTTINKKLGGTVAIKGGAMATNLTDNNIGVVSDGTGTLNVKLAKTLTGLDSVTAGGTTINSGGLTVETVKPMYFKRYQCKQPKDYQCC